MCSVFVCTHTHTHTHTHIHIRNKHEIFQDWPLHCEADFEFLEEDTDSTPQTGSDGGSSSGGGGDDGVLTTGTTSSNEGRLVWRRERINMLNMIATNCHRLGVDHPIHPTTEIDNGWLDVVFLGGGHSRGDAARAGLYMKSGKYLSSHKAMSSRRVKEFKM